VGPEQRRILMVISDGAPADDSILSINSGNYPVVSQFEN
jgi:cobaltochelatase CobT